MKLKVITFLATASLLAGCNAVTGEVRHTLNYMFKNTPDVELSAEEIEAFPYTALYMNLEGSPQSLVVLGFIDGDNYSWMSGNRETVVTRHGRIVRTVGLHANLRGVSDISADPLRCIIQAPDDCPSSWTRTHDFEKRDHTLVSRTVRSEFEVADRVTLTLPAGDVEATLVREHVTVSMGHRSYVNEFWLEDDGHVVKSRQMTLLDEPRFTLTQVKWVGR